MKQHDKHWPYLTLRETLRYAAELYDVALAADLEALIDEIIRKMGLTGCADTRNANLSGGQRRRLSIGIALLKQPTLLFLDEPTSGKVTKGLRPVSSISRGVNSCVISLVQ